MAIKGKSKSRGGKGKTRGVAPKPVIVERKVPLLSRKPVQRGLIVVLGLLALFGGLRVWQNLHRSNALRKYDRALIRSQGLLTVHLDPQQPTSMSKNETDFGSGKLKGKQFQDLASLWEKDFRAAKDAVAKLKPPEQLREAQNLILKGIDGYIHVSRLYQVAGIQRQIAEDGDAIAKATKDPVQKKKLEAQAKKDADQVQVLLLHAKEAQDEADAVYKLGSDKVDALKVAWHIEQKSTSQQGSVPVGLVDPFQAFLRRAA